MAGNDTAALVVALSAQLTKFEKDMKGAVDIADRRVKEIETRFGAMNNAINRQFDGLKSQMASQLGGIGSVLLSLGPIGAAIALTVGGVALAFTSLSDRVEEFAEKAKRMKEVAETAGVSLHELRAIMGAGRKVGLEPEQTESFLNRLTIAIEELRTKGTGALFDQLTKIDTALVREIASARDTAAAIDILARAYANLDNQLTRNALVASVAGKRNLAGGRLLGEIADKGGVGQMVDDARAAGKAIDENLINKVVDLKREIEAIKRDTANLWGGAFAPEVLEQQKRSADFWNSIAKSVLTVKSNAPPTSVGGPEDWMMPPGERTLPERLKGATFADRFVRPEEQFGALNRSGNVPFPRARPTEADAEKAKASATVELELMRRWMTVLGEAATPAEQLKLKRLELAAAAEKGGVSTDKLRRAEDAFLAVQKAAALAIRERLGIATEQEIIDVKLAQLQRDRVNLGLSENEVQKATVMILREAKQAADALAVRQAYLPGLKQLELDAQNVRKSLDELAVNSVTNIGDGLTDMITRTKSVSDAFRDMANSIIRDLVRMAVKQTILGPLAGALGGLLGGSGVSAGFTGSASAGTLSFGGPRAGGGPVERGMAYLVGENGPELFAPGTSGRIIPNDVARRSSSGGVTVAPVINVDATGADAASIMRLERALAGVAGSIKSVALQAVAEHSRRFA